MSGNAPPPPPASARKRFLVALAAAALAVGLPLAALAVLWGAQMAGTLGDAPDPRAAVCTAPPVDDGSLRAAEIDLRRRIAEAERNAAARLAQCRPAPRPEPPPEPVPPPEPPPPPPPRAAQVPPPDTQPCNVEARSGGRGVTETRHFLGAKPGRAVIAYNMLREPDRLQVFHGGRELAATSGFVSGRATIAFDWNPPPEAGAEDLVVRVVVSGKPGSSSTRWSYRLGCPGENAPR